jgi:riboflavin synthase
MFTGIVEELGTVEFCENRKLSVRCHTVMSDMTLGASIAVNGVCLTAVELRPDGFSADLAQETLDRTSLGDLRAGHPVNLERPLMLQTRLSGHIVQGHVDGTGIIESWENSELVVRVPPQLDRFLVYKGSVCLDGISLTVAAVENGLVKIAIIPHTAQATNLYSRKPGDRINIECDILAKHVDRLLAGHVLSNTHGSNG